MEELQEEFIKFRKVLNVDQPGYFELNLFNKASDLLKIQAVQALKDRYQLGLVYKVINPHATHKRFEHTVGVVSKCIVTCDILNEKALDEIKLTDHDIIELIIAAALHDCGHLPFSHATERAYRTVKGLTKGISHEERIIPLIINRNEYFNDLRHLVFSEWKMPEITLYRIASIICPELTELYEQTVPNFIRPKKAIQQLLVSDIDMDRLDYILRDSEILNYYPVTLLRENIVSYVKGLSLFRYKSLKYSYNGTDKQSLFNSTKSNVELCLDKKYVENVFYLLVSRVLLYKYIYFSEKVRSFEGILTYLISVLIENHVALNPLNLIAMGDEYFLNNYLDELITNLEDNNLAKHLKDKYINILQYEKIERFKLLTSINPEVIKNPRLKEEFENNINNRTYIDNLKNYVNYKANSLTENKERFFVGSSELLIDVFKLKTGGGDLLVHDKNDVYYTLKKTMNGSNMHRLCNETRVDIYYKTDISKDKRNFIKMNIDKFFTEI